MCGIAGYVGVEAVRGLSILKRMALAQAHRGPDGEGCWNNDSLGLAHRRLAVIDREGGAQPVRSPDGRYVLSYNGEIYNFRELRDELERLGWDFRTTGDTEVVLAAWTHWGKAAFDRFDGMFGIAIADTETNEMVLARDQFGIKPVYLATAGTQTVFASELRPILATGLIPARPDDVTVYRYLRFRVHDDTERTFFEGISRLMPGQLAIVRPDGTVRRETYTRLYRDLRELSGLREPYDEQARERFASALRDSVHSRLVSDVPVGTALSGGLDSSTIVASINAFLTAADDQDPLDSEGPDVDLKTSVGAQQQTFSAVFPGQVNDEEAYVDELAGGCPKLRVHKVRPQVDEFRHDLRDFVRSQEEPVISTGPYAQYCVMRAASEHVTVMIDGQGADEMMAGYFPYFLVYARQLRKLGGSFRTVTELAGVSGTLLRVGTAQLIDRMMLRGHSSAETLLAPDFVASHRNEKLTIIPDDLKERLEDDLLRQSLPALLRYEDRNTMRFSIEGRVPFLNADLLRTLWRLDDTAILHNGWNKRALRDATRDLLPAMINRRRRKMGFTTPEDAWFGRLHDLVHNVFSSASFGRRPYFNQESVVRAYDEFRRGRSRTETMTFWRLLNLELWLREFIDPEPVTPPAVDERGDDGRVGEPCEEARVDDKNFGEDSTRPANEVVNLAARRFWHNERPRNSPKFTATPLTRNGR